MAEEKMNMEITDRYDALGIKPPEPGTCCKGQCEGTGFIPIFIKKNLNLKVYGEDEKDPRFIKLWEEAETKKPTDDGYHFVKCEECNGTGKNMRTEVKKMKLELTIEGLKTIRTEAKLCRDAVKGEFSDRWRRGYERLEDAAEYLELLSSRTVEVEKEEKEVAPFSNLENRSDQYLIDLAQKHDMGVSAETRLIRKILIKKLKELYDSKN